MTWARRAALPLFAIPNDSGTQRFDMPRRGPLSALFIELRWTNGSTSNVTEPIFDAFDRVRLLYNGDKVLTDLVPLQLWKWGHLYHKGPPPWVRDQQASAVQRAYLTIPFGRYLGDPNMWFPANQVRDLTLEVEYSPTIAATEWATGTGRIGVFAYEFINGTPPGPYHGFLTLQEIRRFTTAASGTEAVELPSDHPIRNILVWAYEAAIEDGVDITDVDLEQGIGGPVVFTSDWLELQADNQSHFEISAREHGVLMASNTDTRDLYQARIIDARLMSASIATIGTTATSHEFVSAYAGSRITIQSLDKDGDATQGADAANTTDRRVNYVVEGIGIGHVVVVPASLTDDPSQYFNFRGIEDPRLLLVQGAAGADTRVSVQKLVAQPAT